jgi:hypothetical protein
VGIVLVHRVREGPGSRAARAAALCYLPLAHELWVEASMRSAFPSCRRIGEQRYRAAQAGDDVHAVASCLFGPVLLTGLYCVVTHARCRTHS